jgi:hypothetical protein
MKHLEITEKEWLRIRQNICEEHGNSMILLRDKIMRRELGFTVRYHQDWRPRDVDQQDVGYHTHFPVQMICIDFYDEQARTWFLLKYT